MPVNLFDANFYRAANHDLANFNDAQALSHFQSSGLNEGRSFSPFVDLNFYRASNSDLASFSNSQALDHLQNTGISEGRRFSQFFDLNFYRGNNADLAGFNNEQIFEHLRNTGVTEGRRFSQFFDVNFYLADNPDVAQAFGGSRLAALNHFEISGLSEGRRFSAGFDVHYYRNVNSDLQAAQLNNKQLLDHFEIYGVKEGRASAESFHVTSYLASNSDLMAAGLNYSQAYEHFVSYGLSEGRIASGYINSDYAGNTVSTARNIALDSHAVIFRESVGNADTSDVYRFNLGSQPNTTFNLVMNGLSANADVELLNSSGQVIARAINSGSATESLSATLEADSYYIRVYQGESGANTNYNLTLSATPQANTAQTPTPRASGNSFIDRVVELTNAQRSQAGLQPLRLNLQLNAAAQAHTEDMAIHDFFAHTALNGSSPSDRTRVAGYSSSYVGENIAAGYATPEAVVQGWMNSPGHRANILNSSYEEIGVGYYYAANDTGKVNYKSYWTQNFGDIS